MTHLKIPVKKVVGRLLLKPASDQVALAISSAAGPSGIPCYLRFALVLLGSERLFFPSILLDDWGHENSKLSLYEWIFIEGDRFPRAELFGYDHHIGQGWQEAQYFVRDLELTARWPAFACEDRNARPGAGHPVLAIGVEKDGCPEPIQIKTPVGIKMPLKRAAVSWWRIPPGYPSADFF